MSDEAVDPESVEERVKEILADEADAVRDTDDNTESTDASVEGDADESS